MTLLSVVFSFRNEAQVLPELIRRVREVMAAGGADYELIFVNDDSTDQSFGVLQAERKQDSRIKIVNMSRRFGVAPCVLAGMEHTKGDAVVYMDTDLQDPPEVIPRLVEAWQRGADVVHTVRRHREGESRFKVLLTGLAYRAIKAGATIPLLVEAGDFKLLSRRAVGHLLQFKESDPYLRGLVAWIGFTQAVVEYDRSPRAAGATHFPLFSSNPWKTFVSGLTSFSFSPIYLILGTGVGGTLLAGVALALGVIAALVGHGPGAWFWLIMLGLCFWASLLVAIGIVGVYLARSYKDIRGRPQYIVRDTVGIDENETALPKQTRLSATAEQAAGPGSE